jgi:hypothetical protein
MRFTSPSFVAFRNTNHGPVEESVDAATVVDGSRLASAVVSTSTEGLGFVVGDGEAVATVVGKAANEGAGTGEISVAEGDGEIFAWQALQRYRMKAITPACPIPRSRVRHNFSISFLFWRAYQMASNDWPVFPII